MAYTVSISERILREARRMAGTVVTDAKAKRWDGRGTATYDEGDVLVAAGDEKSVDHAQGSAGTIATDLELRFAYIHRPDEDDTVVTDTTRTRYANLLKAALLANRTFVEGGAGGGGTTLAFDLVNVSQIEAPQLNDGQVDFVLGATVRFLHDAADPGTLSTAVVALSES